MGHKYKLKHELLVCIHIGHLESNTYRSKPMDKHISITFPHHCVRNVIIRMVSKMQGYDSNEYHPNR